MPLSSRVALSRRASRWAARSCGTRRSCASGPARTRRCGSSGSTTSRTTAASSEFVGDLPEDAAALFYPTVTRSAADPDEISAGAGIGYFSLVWNIGQGLNRDIIGGPSTLTQGIAAALGDRVQLERRGRGGRPQQALGRRPIPAGRRGPGGRGALRRAGHPRDGESPGRRRPPRRHPRRAGQGRLRPVRQRRVPHRRGHPAAVGRRVRHRHPQAVVQHRAEPGQPRARAAKRRGSPAAASWRSRRPASPARCWPKTDEEILRTYTDDLNQVLGKGFGDSVVEAQVQRWETGAPYCFPGRGALQPTLTRRGSRVLLAGDYLGTLYTETAIRPASRPRRRPRACSPPNASSARPAASRCAAS